MLTDRAWALRVVPDRLLRRSGVHHPGCPPCIVWRSAAEDQQRVHPRGKHNHLIRNPRRTVYERPPTYTGAGHGCGDVYRRPPMSIPVAVRPPYSRLPAGGYRASTDRVGWLAGMLPRASVSRLHDRPRRPFQVATGIPWHSRQDFWVSGEEVAAIITPVLAFSSMACQRHAQPSRVAAYGSLILKRAIRQTRRQTAAFVASGTSDTSNRRTRSVPAQGCTRRGLDVCSAGPRRDHGSRAGSRSSMSTAPSTGRRTMCFRSSGHHTRPFCRQRRQPPGGGPCSRSFSAAHRDRLSGTPDPGLTASLLGRPATKRRGTLVGRHHENPPRRW